MNKAMKQGEHNNNQRTAHPRLRTGVKGGIPSREAMNRSANNRRDGGASSAQEFADHQATYGAWPHQH